MNMNTPNLSLSPFSDDDAQFLLELLNDPGWIANIGDKNIRTVDAALAYLVQKLRPGMWVLAKDKAGQPVGLCGLVTGRDGLNCPDIGYAVIDREKNKGYATEIAAALLDHIDATMDIHRLGAITSPSSLASQRVLEKCGFNYVDHRDLPKSGGIRAYYERVCIRH